MSGDLIPILFLVILFSGFLIYYRKRISIQKIIGGKFFGKEIPIMYLALFRTKVGLKFMDAIAQKYPNFLKRMGNWAIGIGFLGMAFICVEIIYSTIKLLTSPVSTGAAALVLPIEAKGVIYVPFTIWILSLAIIVTIHEFGHGIMARLYKVPVKSTGLAALGFIVPLIPAAFVEPNEKKLFKKPVKEQLAVFAAGPFVNIVMGLALIPLVMFSMAPAIDGLYDYQGITVNSITDDPAYPIVNSALVEGTLLTQIDDVSLTRWEEFSEYLATKKMGEEVVLTSKAGETFAIILGEHPEKAGAGYLGVVTETVKELSNPSLLNKFYVWIYDFFMWLLILNLGVGLFNLLPIGIVDGGRMIKLVFHNWFKEHHAKFAYAATSACFLFVVVAGVVVNFIG